MPQFLVPGYAAARAASVPAPRRQLPLPSQRPRGTGGGNGKGLNFLSNLAGFKVRRRRICSDMFEKTNKVVTLGRMWLFFFSLTNSCCLSKQSIFLCENTYNVKKMSNGEPTPHAKELIFTPRLLPVCPCGPSLPCPHGGGTYGFKTGANRLLHPREGIRTQHPTWATGA